MRSNLNVANSGAAPKSRVLSASSLKNKTQKAALQLLRKEEDNATKSRLESLLFQQYSNTYGTKQANSAVNSFIRTTIREFLDGLVNVKHAESKLGDLESSIKAGVENLKANLKKSRQQQSQKEEKDLAHANSQKQMHIQQALQQQQLKVGAGQGQMQQLQLRPEEDAQWPVINAIIALSAEEQQKQKDREAVRKKEKYQQELHDQVNSIRSRQEQTRREKEEAARIVKDDLSKYELDQLQQKKSQEEKFARERTMRLSQIEERNQQREQERQNKIAQEQREMARARRAQEEAEELRQRAKEREKLAQDRLLVENEHNKAIKMEELRKQREYETKLQRDYEAKLAKEEADRTAAFKARMDALQNFSKSYEARVGARLEEARRQEDDKVHASLIEAERLRAEKEDRSRAQKKASLLASTEYNIRMMEEKQRIKDQDRMESIERRRKLEMEAQEQKRKEREANDQKRLKMMEIKQQLDSQMRQKARNQREEIALSSVEMRFNKSIIEKVNNDPALAKRVLDRVHPVVSTSRSDNTHRNIFA